MLSPYRADRISQRSRYNGPFKAFRMSHAKKPSMQVDPNSYIPLQYHRAISPVPEKTTTGLIFFLVEKANITSDSEPSVCHTQSEGNTGKPFRETLLYKNGYTKQSDLLVGYELLWLSGFRYRPVESCQNLNDAFVERMF